MIKTSKIITAFIFTAAFIAMAMPGTTQAAELYFKSEKDNFTIGDNFAVNVKINSETGINAAQATIEFPKNVLEITSVDKTGSIFEFWLREPDFSNDTGRLVFIGGSSKEFKGESLQVIKINFKVKSAGAADIIFTDGAVTAYDNNGTNVLSVLRGAQIVSAPKIEKTTAQKITQNSPEPELPAALVKETLPKEAAIASTFKETIFNSRIIQFLMFFTLVAALLVIGFGIGRYSVIRKK